MDTSWEYKKVLLFERNKSQKKRKREIKENLKPQQNPQIQSETKKKWICAIILDIKEEN